MNAQEKKQLGYLTAAKLDQALTERFGEAIEAKTSYSFLTFTYLTHYKAEGVLKERIEEFIAGWQAGVLELAERLRRPELFL